LEAVADAHLNAIGSVVPGNEVHALFAAYAPHLLADHRVLDATSPGVKADWSATWMSAFPS
jgi:hypothetical protein